MPSPLTLLYLSSANSVYHKLLTGCSYGTAKSGVGICAMSVLRPDQMMKCVVPVIMAGIIAVSILMHFGPLLRHCLCA